MKQKLILAGLIAAMLGTNPAMAQNWNHGGRDSHGRPGMDHGGGHGGFPGYSAPRRGYREHRMGRNDHFWRGNDGRYYCRRNDGTTGLIVGGALGALAGGSIAGPGDTTLGALLGGAGGALLGRSVDRGDYRCR